MNELPSLPAAATFVAVALAVWPVCVHVKQNVPDDVAEPVPSGPGPTAEVMAPMSVVTVAAVPIFRVFVAAVTVAPSQSPVVEGTALLPEEMATRLSPQLSACAR